MKPLLTTLVSLCFIGSNLGCNEAVHSTSDDCQSLYPCGGDATLNTAPTTDGSIGASDEEPYDALPFDRSVTAPDGSVPLDASPQVDSWQPPCEPSEGVPVQLSDWILDQRINNKTPSSLGRIATINLVPDTPGSMQFFTVSEGRLFSRDAEGELRWQTGLLGLDKINAIEDLEGDGDLEIVVSGPSMVAIVDVGTGNLLWFLPTEAFGDSIFSTLAQLLITDLTGDGLKDIYVTNGGCGSSGDGKGLIFGHENDQFILVGQLSGNRLNGKCGAWQTVFDIDGDGRSELLITDGNGLNAFDTQSGNKSACGRVNAPPNGPLPTHFFPTPNGPRWLVAVNDTLHKMALAPDETCSAGQSFESEWSVELNSPFISNASGMIYDHDGYATHFVFNASDNAAVGGVVSLNLESGATAQVDLESELLGVVSRPDMPGPYLITQSTQSTGATQVDVLEPSPQGWQVRARFESVSPKLMTEPSPLWATKAFKLPMIASEASSGLPHFLLEETSELQGSKQIFSVSIDGVKTQIFPGEFSGDIRPFCATFAPCSSAHTSRFLLTDTDGVVWSVDLNDTSAMQEHFTAFSGLDQLIPIDGSPGYLGVLSRRGVLTVYQESRRGFEKLQEIEVGSPARKFPFGVGARIDQRPIFVIRDPRQSQSAWSAFDGVTGLQLWHHSLSDDQASVFNQPVLAGGTAPIFMRLDYSADNIVPQDPTCNDVSNTVPPDFFEPHPNCPDKAVRSRVITALDPITGTCKWRRIFKPVYPLNEPGVTYGCPGPVNQRLSLVRDQQDQGNIAFVTESMSLRSFRTDSPPASGNPDSFENTFIFGKNASGANIGGGQISRSPAGDTLLLHGGSTPPMRFDAQLNRLWSTQAVEAIRGQSWLLQDAVDLGSKVFTSATGGYPLIEIDSNTGVRTQYWGLRDGQVQSTTVFSSNYPAILQLLKLTNLDERLLAVTTNESMIYFFDEAGQFISSFQSTTPILNLTSLNFGTQKRLAYSTGGGRVSIIKQPIVRNATPVFDVDCPPIYTCDPSTDIDETSVLNQLCLAWTPVRDAIGYEVTVETENGLPLKPWTRIGVESGALIDGLELIPTQRYVGVVRAIYEVDNQIEFSSVSYSDGVVIAQSEPPTSQIDATLNETDRILEIQAYATDDDQLSRWRIDILDQTSGQLIRRVGSGSLSAPEWSASFSVDISTFDTDLPEVDSLVIELEVSDRSGQEASARSLITLR